MAARYDADFEAAFGGPDRGDLAFFERVAAESTGPIAEIGAGTGRVIGALARSHPTRQCVGIEPSAAMRVQMHERHPSVRALDGRFDAIPLPDRSQGFVFAAFRSFQHLLGVDEQLAGLHELRRVLAPGGWLALDLFDPDYTRLRTTPWARGLVYLRGAARVERWERRVLDRREQVVEISYRWIERHGERVVASERASYRVRYTFASELLHLLTRAGFDAIDIRGDYDGRALDGEARELIVTARS